MVNKPSPVVGTAPADATDDEALEQARVNSLFVRAAQAGIKEYRQQVAQDVAWHLREGVPLADGVEPAGAFPKIRYKLLRYDRLERIEFYAEVRALRRDQGLSIDVAIEQWAENSEAESVEDYDRMMSNPKGRYEKEMTQLNKERDRLMRKIDEILGK